MHDKKTLSYYMFKAVEFLKFFIDPSKRIKEEQQKKKEKSNENMYPLW